MNGPSLQRLNRNHGGYRGETIDLPATLTAFRDAAHRTGWTLEDVPAGEALQLLAAHRAPVAPPDGAPILRVYLSAGIHGDEPAGPLALRQLMKANAWPPGCPFAPRCRQATSLCHSTPPPVHTEPTTGHACRCHFANH